MRFGMREAGDHDREIDGGRGRGERVGKEEEGGK
jgi:hypothetical protein